MILREEQIGCLLIEPMLLRHRGLVLSMPHPDDWDGKPPVQCHLDEQDVRHLRDLLTEALDD